MAALKADQLLGQFRRDDAHDPGRFATAAIAIMQDYPPVVLDKVCHPVEGLATKVNFMPTLMELREELNLVFTGMIAKWHVDHMPQERKDSIKAFLTGDDTRRPPPRPLLEGSKQPVETRPNLTQKYGKDYGLKRMQEPPSMTKGNLPSQAMTKEALVDHYSRHGLAFTKKPHVKEKHNGDDISE